jgi:hypothetical protein
MYLNFAQLQADDLSFHVKWKGVDNFFVCAKSVKSKKSRIQGEPTAGFDSFNLTATCSTLYTVRTFQRQILLFYL